MRISARHFLLWMFSTAPIMIFIFYIFVNVRQDTKTLGRLNDSWRLNRQSQFKVLSHDRDAMGSQSGSAASDDAAQDGLLLYQAAETLWLQAKVVGLSSPVAVDLSDEKAIDSSPSPGSEWPEESIANVFLQHASPLIQALQNPVRLDNAASAWKQFSRIQPIVEILKIEFQYAHYHGETDRALRAIRTAADVTIKGLDSQLAALKLAPVGEGGFDAKSLIGDKNGPLQSIELVHSIAIHQMIRDALGVKGYDDIAQWDIVDEILIPSISIDLRASALLQYRKQNSLAQIPSAAFYFRSQDWQRIHWNAKMDIEQLAAETSEMRADYNWTARDTLGWIAGAAIRLPRTEANPRVRGSLTTPLIGQYARLTESLGSGDYEASGLILSFARVEEDRRMLRLAIAAKKLFLQGEAVPESSQKIAELANLPQSEALDLFGRPFVIERQDDLQAGFKFSRVDDSIGTLLAANTTNQLQNLLTMPPAFFLNWIQRASIIVR